jgi:hypothetical protein
LGLETQLPFEKPGAKPTKRTKKPDVGGNSSAPAMRVIVLGVAATLACGVMVLALLKEEDAPAPAQRASTADPQLQAQVPDRPAQGAPQEAVGVPAVQPAALPIQPVAEAVNPQQAVTPEPAPPPVAAQPAAPPEQPVPARARAAAGEVAKPVPTPAEQRAADAAAHYYAGRYSEALVAYRQLAAEQPAQPAFAAMARMIERRSRQTTGAGQ